MIFSVLTDPYVKVWLMFGDKRVEKKKTPVYKCNLNPMFNQARLQTYCHQPKMYFLYPGF